MAYFVCQLYWVKDAQVSCQTCLGGLYEMKQISPQLGCTSSKVLKDWAESRMKFSGWLILSSWLLSRDVNLVFLKWDWHHVFSGFPGLWSWPRIWSTDFSGLQTSEHGSKEPYTEYDIIFLFNHDLLWDFDHPNYFFLFFLILF